MIMNENEQRPERAKSRNKLLILPFQGVVDTVTNTQGVALCWCIEGFQP